MPTNQLISTQLLTKHAVFEFKNSMNMLAKVDRQLDSKFATKVGDTIDVRKRVRYNVVKGQDITGQINNTHEGKVSIKLEHYRTVPFDFDSIEQSHTVEYIAERYIRPAMIELSQEVETTIAEQYKKVWNFIGTPGTLPSTFKIVGEVAALMAETGVPKDMICGFYHPRTILELSDGLKNVFPNKIAKTAIEEAFIHKYAQIYIYENTSLVAHTNGTHTTGSTPLVAAAAQNVQYEDVNTTYDQDLLTDGWAATTAILKEGDVFTLAGVFTVNARTRKSTGQLQTFTVRADVTSDAAGLATIKVSPQIIIDGPYQTVDVVPADNAAITMVSGTEDTTYVQNLAFHRDAITVAFAKLRKPAGNVEYSQQSFDNVSIRLWANSDILTGESIWRFDILYAVEVQNPGFAVRTTS